MAISAAHKHCPTPCADTRLHQEIFGLQHTLISTCSKEEMICKLTSLFITKRSGLTPHRHTCSPRRDWSAAHTNSHVDDEDGVSSFFLALFELTPYMS